MIRKVLSYAALCSKLFPSSSIRSVKFSTESLRSIRCKIDFILLMSKEESASNSTCFFYFSVYLACMLRLFLELLSDSLCISPLPLTIRYVSPFGVLSSSLMLYLVEISFFSICWVGGSYERSVRVVPTRCVPALQVSVFSSSSFLTELLPELLP